MGTCLTVCVVFSHGTPLSPPKHRRKGIGKTRKSAVLLQCLQEPPERHMSHSLKSLKGVYRRDYIGDYYGVIKGDTRSLDNGSYYVK